MVDVETAMALGDQIGAALLDITKDAGAPLILGEQARLHVGAAALSWLLGISDEECPGHDSPAT